MSTLSRLTLAALIASLTLPLSACQATAGSRATLNVGDAGTREAVASALAKAVNRARVELGATDGVVTSVVTVLPPPPGPYETHSTAIPLAFDIEIRDGRCVAVRRDSREAYDLPGVVCAPAP